MDIELIRQKKETYGDNFADVSKDWSEFLGTEIKPNEVAFMMHLLKQARIKNIKGNFKDLEKALKDSLIDRDNYLYISAHFDEYEAIK